jgi:hypothetical protein
MPTKERKQKEQEKRDEEARLNKMFAEPPDYLRHASSVNFPKGILEIPPECNLKGGLVYSDEDGNLIPDFEAIKRGARNAGNTPSDIRKDQVQHLQNKYPKLWGTSEGVKKIADEEGLSERTIRRYFKIVLDRP